jgi:ATP-dependent helicase/nuclease subunit A
VADARAAQKRAQEDEYRRLLYVAMTRAEERLIIAGYQGVRQPAEECWYKMVRRSLEPGTEEVPDPAVPGATVLRRGRSRAGAGTRNAASPERTAHSLPAWLQIAASPEPEGAPRVQPSHALDMSRAVARSEALAEGRLLHALLQHLPDVPVEARSAAGERFLGAQEPPLPAEMRAAMLSKATAVLDHPACLPLFGPGSLAEVEIAATVTLPDGYKVEVPGRIDRLTVHPDQVLFCDFKTGAPPDSLGDTPPAYNIQAALYRAALASLYPGRPVRAFLIWTNGPIVVELPSSGLDEALACISPEP